MSDDKFLYELRGEMPVEFGKKLYQKLQRQERQRSFSTLVAALVVTMIGMTMLFARFSAPSVLDTAQVSLTNLQPITGENVSQLQLLRTLGSGFIIGVDWSSDGETIAIATTQGVFLHNASDLSAERRLSEEMLSFPTYSPDGSMLAGVVQSAVVLLNAATGEVLHQIQTDNFLVERLQFNADGSQIATTACQNHEEQIEREFQRCGDFVVQLWDTVSGDEIVSLMVGEMPQQVVLNDDFSLMAWIDEHSHLYVRRTNSEEQRQLINAQYASNAFVIGFHGDRLVAVIPHTTRPAYTWDTDTIFDEPEVIQSAQNATRETDRDTKMWFLDDERVLISDNYTGEFELRTLSNGERTMLSIGVFNIYDAAVSPDRLQIVLTNFSSVFKVDLMTGEHTALLRDYTGYANELTFSPDHSLLVAGIGPGGDRIWDLEAGTSRLLFEDEYVPDLLAGHIVFTPDAAEVFYGQVNLMTTLSPDRTFTILHTVSQGVWRYNLATHERHSIEASAPFISNPADAMHMQEDGTLIVVHSVIRTISRIASDETITSVPMQGTDDNEVFLSGHRAVISQDGTRLAMTACSMSDSDYCDMSEVFVWDTETGELLHRLQRDAGVEYSTLSFNVDASVIAAIECTMVNVESNGRFVSYCPNNAITLWDISEDSAAEPRAPLATIEHTDDLDYGFAISPGSEGDSLLVVALAGNQIEAWQINRDTGDIRTIDSIGAAGSWYYGLLTFSADGELLAIGGLEGIQLWGVPEQ